MTIDKDALYTAMCLWEALLKAKDEKPEIDAAFHAIGTVGMRFHTASWVERCDADYKALVAAEPDVSIEFDWEYVPDWIGRNIDWSDASNPVVIS